MGGADWHLVSLLESFPDGLKCAVLTGRADKTARPPDGIDGPHFIKKLDKKAPFSSEVQVGRELKSFIDKNEPNLIHVHNILNPHLLETLAEFRPAVITVQDHRFFCPGRGKVLPDDRQCFEPPGLGCSACFRDEDYFMRLMLLVRARLKALSKFPALITLSEYMKGELVQAGLPEERIKVIHPFPHGLDLTLSSAAFGRKVLFAGRLVRAKGVFDLVEALALAGDRVQLVFAGAGPAEEELREKVEELNLSDRVEFKGWVPHEDLSRLYREARLVVLPSLWREPFGITGLEAQAMGRPTAAYDSGGVTEWLEDGRTGVTIPPGNVLALASAMNVLTRESNLADGLGRTGRRIAAEKFSREEMMNRLTDLYRTLTGGDQRGAEYGG